MKRGALLLYLLLPMLGACDAKQRGCASRAREATADPILSEIDCPGGIAKCEGGLVDVSVSARRPANCRGETCACPRRGLGLCGGEKPPPPCVQDGIEIAVKDDDDALARLCRVGSTFATNAGIVLADLPPSPVDVECTHGELRTSTSAVVARCAKACAVEGDAIPSTHIDVRALVHLMCAR